MEINEEIAKAFGAHGAWKTRIIQAIDSGHSDHKPADVAVDNRCAFGKWLYDPALPGEVRASEDYRNVVQLHAEFHRAAGATLAKALQGDHEGAHSELKSGLFARSAEALSAAMVRWQRNAATQCSGRASVWRSTCFFLKQRISTRIMATVAIPVVVAVIAVMAFDARLLAVANGTGRMERATDLLLEVTATTQEAQKERGLSTAVASNADDGIRIKRKAQMELTNRQRAKLLAAGEAMLPDMPAGLQERWQTAAAALSAVDPLRLKVDGGSIEAAKVVAGYSEIIDKLIDFEEASAVLAVRPEVARAMTALLRISRAKESAGKERATASGAIARGAIAPEVRRRLLELSIDQEVRFNSYLGAATGEQHKWLEQAMADPAVAQVTKYRAALGEGNLAGMTVDAWFGASTARIDRLHQVEEHIVSDIRQSAHAVNAEAWRDMSIVTGLIVLAILGGGVFVVFMARGITLPILSLTENMRRLAAGDSQLKVPSTDRPDEVGEMARAVLVFQQQAITVDQLTAEQELQRRKNEEGRRQALSEMAGHIEGDARAVHSAAQEISSAVESQAATSSEMSSSVAEITSTMEELSSSSSQVAEHSQAVVSMAEKTWENSKAGADAMQSMLERMEEIRTDNRQSLKVIEELGHRSKEISKIMQIIESVADQTKLIAFNAALEASSAGESGKRFSVVAAEIRRLADNVTDSAGEISGKVGEIQDAISHLVVTAEKGAERIGVGMDESTRVADILGGLETAAHESSTAAQQISLATQQQRTASSQVVIALREIVGASSQTAESIGRISDVARNMTSLSQQLETLVGRYQLRSPAKADG